MDRESDRNKSGYVIRYRSHALQRMFQRGISPLEIESFVGEGEVIEAYPDDYPYPSSLLLIWVGHRPIHIVLAQNHVAREWILITAYEPDEAKWDGSFRRRKP